MANRFASISFDQIMGVYTLKSPVRAATTTNGTLATSFIQGATIDGVVLATGNRILIKDQTTTLQNGVYVVTAGAPVRAVDFDNDVVATGFKVDVLSGLVNALTTWIVTNLESASVIGTNALVFTQDDFNGILPVARGGTGVGTLTVGNVLVGNGISPVLSTKVAPTGAFVGDSDAQTLTNKTLSAANQQITNAGTSFFFTPGGTPGTFAQIISLQTSNVTLNLPVASGTLALTSQAIPPIGSSTDFGIVRWNGTTGGLVQNCGTTIDNSGNMAGINSIFMPNAVTASNAGTISFGGVNAIGPRASGYYFAGAGNFTATGLRNFIAGTGAAGNLITTGNNNTGYGFTNSSAIAGGSQNSCFGYTAGNSITSGNNNSIYGGSGNLLTTGSQNTIIGDVSGNAYTGAESNNTLIGYNVTGTLGESNVIRIGNGSVTAAYLQGIFGVTASLGAQNVVINSGGKMGVGFSTGQSPYAQGNYTANSFAAGASLALASNTPTEVTTGGIFSFTGNSFTLGASNRIVYSGTNPTTVLVNWAMSSLNSALLAHNMVLSLRTNGASNGPAAQALQNSGTANCMAGSTVVTLNSGNYVSVFVTDMTGATTLTIGTVNITIVTIP